MLVAAERGDGETALREAQQEPDEGYRRFLLALAHYGRGDRVAADAALGDLIANGRDNLAYQIAEVYAVRGEKIKLSSGCKSRSIITTLGCCSFYLIRCCAACAMIPATRRY